MYSPADHRWRQTQSDWSRFRCLPVFEAAVILQSSDLLLPVWKVRHKEGRNKRQQEEDGGGQSKCQCTLEFQSLLYTRLHLENHHFRRKHDSLWKTATESVLVVDGGNRASASDQLAEGAFVCVTEHLRRKGTRGKIKDEYQDTFTLWFQTMTFIWQTFRNQGGQNIRNISVISQILNPELLTHDNITQIWFQVN